MLTSLVIRPNKITFKSWFKNLLMTFLKFPNIINVINGIYYFYSQYYIIWNRGWVRVSLDIF